MPCCQEANLKSDRGETTVGNELDKHTKQQISMEQHVLIVDHTESSFHLLMKRLASIHWEFKPQICLAMHDMLAHYEKN